MSELSPERGEIWWVDFEPATGSEARTTRPSVVLSSNALAHLPIRLVPLTTWQARFGPHPNKVRIAPDRANGLRNESGADVLLPRGVSTDRFGDRIGVVATPALDDIARALAIVAVVPR